MTTGSAAGNDCSKRRDVMGNISKKVEHEKKILGKMMKIYCKGQGHDEGNIICDECSELLAYATTKIDRCPFQETKTFCSNCKVHCYDLDHRERIKKVMRYAGPRMIFKAPVTVIYHVICSINERHSK